MRRIWKALNHAGMALFVFVTLTGVLLWSTGSLHLGPAPDQAAAHSADDGHGDGQADEHSDDDGHGHGEEWCAEHDVAESACTRCDPSLIPAFKAKDDWCAEHKLPESQCTVCNPGCKEGHEGHDDPLAAIEKRKCEHGLAILECDECRFEVGVVKVEPSVAKALLKTATARRHESVVTLRLTGEVQLDKTRVVDVPPTAAGRVIEVNALLGQVVKRGDLLAVIHSGDLGEAKAAYLNAYTGFEIARKEQARKVGVTAALRRLVERLAKANGGADKTGPAGKHSRVPEELVGEWKSKLVGAAARLKLAKSVHDREEDLWKKRVSSKADYETASHELQTAQVAFTSLVEEVQLNLTLDKLRADNAARKAEVALNVAEQRLRVLGLPKKDIAALHDGALPNAALHGKKGNGDFADLAISAPRSGTIITQNVTVGKFVETSQSLYTIADLSNLWVWCDLYERDLAALHKQLAKLKTLPATVHVAAFPDTAFPGTIDLMDSTMDEHTRTVKVRVQVPNGHGKLKPGMFANVEVKIPSGRKATLVPRAAVLSDEGQHFVFQRWKEDFWVRRDVTVGQTQGPTWRS